MPPRPCPYRQYAHTHTRMTYTILRRRVLPYGKFLDQLPALVNRTTAWQWPNNGKGSRGTADSWLCHSLRLQLPDCTLSMYLSETARDRCLVVGYRLGYNRPVMRYSLAFALSYAPAGLSQSRRLQSTDTSAASSDRGRNVVIGWMLCLERI
jgi:hypothetical protein